MKRFLKLVLLFLIPFLLLGTLAECLLGAIPNRFKEQLVYLTSHEDDIETMILGSSHTLYGVRPRYLDSHAFNLSNISQTLDIDAKLLYHFGSDMKHLKHVVLRLSYTTLYEKLEIGTEQWRLKDYERTLNVDVSEKLSYNFEILSVGLKENTHRLIEYYIKNNNDINYTDKGWSDALSKRKPTNLDTSGKATAIKHTALNDDLLEENKRILKDMVQWCQSKNIEVILLTMPAYSSYYNNLNHQQLSTTIKFGEQMQKKFDNCKYYNVLKDPRFTETDFYDGDHLNAEGAKKFSILINSLLSH